MADQLDQVGERQTAVSAAANAYVDKMEGIRDQVGSTATTTMGDMVSATIEIQQNEMGFQVKSSLPQGVQKQVNAAGKELSQAAKQ